MARTTEQGTSWEPVVTDKIQAWHIGALLEENLPCVILPGFFSSDWCQEVTRRFLAFSAAHPDHRVRLQPSAAIDITLDTTTFPLDFFAQQRPANLEPYFAGVPRDAPGLRAMYKGGVDPLDAVRAAMTAIEWKELAALEGDKPFHTDVLWGLSGRYRSMPHVDSFHREVECSLSHYTNRLNFETLVAGPDEGVTFRFYRRYRVGEESLEDALRDAVTCTYVAKPGDLIVYDASKYYEIISLVESGLRLMSHMGAGIDTGAREFSIFT